jgi:hypothetical protein
MRTESTALPPRASGQSPYQIMSIHLLESEAAADTMQSNTPLAFVTAA